MWNISVLLIGIYMTSVKVKFRPSTVEGRMGTVYFQITHARKVKLVFSKYFIFPGEWNGARGAVVVPTEPERAVAVSVIRQRIRWDVELLTRIARRLDDEGIEFSADDVAEEFRGCRHESSLTNFTQGLIAEKIAKRHARTAEVYEASLRRFRVFLCERCGEEDIQLYQITPQLIEAYEVWLSGRGVMPNTSSFYMRSLRAVYNRAVDMGLTEDRRPFRHVYKGVGRTEKRAVPLGVLRRIKQLDLSGEPDLDFARDVYMLSLMLRGMSIVDMAFLRKTDLVDGHIIYNRSKTGQRLMVEWLPEMQAIVDKYPCNPTEFLLPILTKDGGNNIHAYRNQGAKINRNLKKVAERVGLGMNLTLYTARHSWASLARSQGVAISVISEGMGHDSERTTRIYLSELDCSVIDSANREILSVL